MPETPASTVRAAQAARVRSYRHRTGATRSTLVDLTALGLALETLTVDQLALFTGLVGDDVVRRALWAANVRNAPEVAHPVAG